MKKVYNRPPYVLAHNADSAGCGHHRIMRPLEIMGRAGYAAGRYDMRVWSDDEIRALRPDVVVWQRQHEDPQLANMKRYREAVPDAFVVYEIDDALSAVPDWSYHKPFLSVDVDERMARAVRLCDAVTVSTNELARHMRRVVGDGAPEIRVVPNMLGADDFDACDMVASKSRRLRSRLRVGWYGGISHKGDLALMTGAVEATASEVDWVFFGMHPETSARFEFHEGVSPREYLARLASLDLDLIVAPIEDNHFNRCKSNLRLIESGACGYPVIASRVLPYVENAPPIEYAEDWTEAIRAFAALSSDERLERGAKLRTWARRNYCLEGEKLDRRIRGWLPNGAKPFAPNLKSLGGQGLVVVAPQPIDDLAPYGRHVTTLEEARESRGDILYVRWNCTVDRDMVDRLRSRLALSSTAAVAPLTNDGGPGGFPRAMMFQNVDLSTGEKIARIVAEEFDGRSEPVIAATGPVILVSRRALDFCGYFESGLSPEAAIVEWCLMAGSRGLRSIVAADCFSVSLTPHIVPGVENMARMAQSRWPAQKLPPDPFVEVRKGIELAFHREHYKTPLPIQAPNYSEWAAIFDTPGDSDRAFIRDEIASWDAAPRFELRVIPSGGVDAVANHDEYLKRYGEDGAEWLLFVREAATLAPHACYMLARAIREVPDAAAFYGDHDYLSPQAVRFDHDFKPLAFDLEMFLCRDYVSPIVAVRRDRLRAIPTTEDGLYRELLELSTVTGSIRHVPRVLAHLRPTDPDREFKARAKRVETANDVLRGVARVSPHPAFVGYALALWEMPVSAPRVSIVIPTKDKVEMISPCLATLLSITDYPDYEVIVVDNGSTKEAAVNYLASITDARVRVLRHEAEFNWSEINNWAAGQATGSMLLFLNDDTRIIEPIWLRAMVANAARRPEVGIVGARLLYPLGAVQHVGVVSNAGLCGHVHKTLSVQAPGYNGTAALNHEATAVTGACMLVKREAFEAVGGFDERFAHNFNDVAFCLRAAELGYKSTVAATAQVQHLEGVTRGPAGQRMREEAKLLADLFPRPDPYWNRNLTFQHTVDGMQVTGMNMDMLRWPGDPWPWRGEDWPSGRVLLVGDDGMQAIKEAREGRVVFRLGAAGYSASVVSPALQNLLPWDVRHTDVARKDLAALGVERIVVCSLPEGGESALGFVRKLGLPVEYRPSSAEAVCPFRNFTPNGKACGGGWRRGECQRCIDDHGSPYGYVSIAAWRAAWGEFFGAVTYDASRLPESAASVIAEVYAEGEENLGAKV